MKYLSPTKGGMLKRIHIEAKVKLAEQLIRCSGDLDMWCEGMGLTLIRHKCRPMKAAIVQDAIFVDSSLDLVDVVSAIAHEWFHVRFHVAVAAYEVLDQVTINRNEKQAIAFAEALKKQVYGG